MKCSGKNTSIDTDLPAGLCRAIKNFLFHFLPRTPFCRRHRPGVIVVTAAAAAAAVLGHGRDRALEGAEETDEEDCDHQGGQRHDQPRRRIRVKRLVVVTWKAMK